MQRMPSEFLTHPLRPLTFSSQRRGPSSTSSRKHRASTGRNNHHRCADIKPQRTYVQISEAIIISICEKFQHSRQSLISKLPKHLFAKVPFCGETHSLEICPWLCVIDLMYGRHGRVSGGEFSAFSHKVLLLRSMRRTRPSWIIKGITTHGHLRDNKQDFYSATSANGGYKHFYLTIKRYIVV